MVLASASKTDWPITLRYYLIGSAILHLIWEVIQLPLYTIWSEPIAKQAFAVLHCTVGDVMIAALALLMAFAVLAPTGWPRSGTRDVWLLLLAFGVGYTVYSEWLNVSVRQSWSYGPLMPTLPMIGTGLSPLLQWIVVPTLCLRLATGGWPWCPANTQSS